jgi:hypothetical protein
MAALDGHDWWEDRIDEDSCQLFPVFCTANISSEAEAKTLVKIYANLMLWQILSSFLKKVREGAKEFDQNGYAPCILHSTDISAITHGSRYPYPAFSSPFIGKTVNEILNLFLSIRRPLNWEWSHSIFFILDEQTARDGKTCVLACDNSHEDNRPEYADEDDVSWRVTKIRCDFEVVLLYGVLIEIVCKPLSELTDEEELITYEIAKERFG